MQSAAHNTDNNTIQFGFEDYDDNYHYGHSEEDEDLIMKEFKNKLNNEYTIVDFIAKEGSLFLSSDVVSKSGFQFRIKADENHIRMFPADEMIFSEFMKFYEFILPWKRVHD